MTLLSRKVIPWVAGLLIVLLAVPLFAGDFWVGILVQLLAFGMLALAVDLLLGHGGMFSMGHAAFFAMASYAVAMLEARHGLPTVVAAPAGVLAATLLAVVFGLAVRTGGVYFILVTLALAQIVYGVSVSWVAFTGGDNGIGGVPFPAVGSLQIESLTAYFYLAFAVTVVVLVLYRLLVSSPFGLTLRGIRESESRMRSLGYNVTAHKYVAFIISGMLAGISGVLYTYANRFVSPHAASFLISAEAALMAIVGGVGTVLGPFVGAAIVLLIRNYLSSFFHHWLLLMGVVFIAAVLWTPEGVMGVLRRRIGNNHIKPPKVST